MSTHQSEPDVALSLWKGLVAICPPRPTMAAIKATVARRHGVTVAQLEGPSRLKRFVLARQEAMWEMHATRLWSLPQIAWRLGGRDHTTVLHGVRRHQARLDEAGTHGHRELAA